MITQDQYDEMKASVVVSLKFLFPQLEEYEAMNLYDTISLIANLQIRLALQSMAEPNRNIVL